MEIPKYSYIISYSPEDEAYICSCREYSGIHTDGETPLEALKDMMQLIPAVVECAKEQDFELAKPIYYGSAD